MPQPQTKRQNPLQDQVLLGSLLGLLANLVMDLPQYPLWKLMLVEHPLSHYAASVFLDLKTLHHTWYGSVCSFLADYTYSAFLGILFVYLLRFAKQRFAVIKGMLYGAFLWLFSFGILRSFPIVKLQEVQPDDILYMFLFHLLFGMALGFFYRLNEQRQQQH